MGKTKKIFSFMIAMMMIISLTACNGKNGDLGADNTKNNQTEGQTQKQSEQEIKKLEPVELSFYFPGDAPRDMDSVLDEFYNRTKDTLNAKLKFIFTPWGEHANKINLAISAGESVDSVFDAQWQSMGTMIAKGVYLNLDEYFNNDQYPGLKKAFEPNYINSNRFVDGSGKEHIYGIPFAQSFGIIQGAVIRKDLREKYGLPEIEGLEDLEKFYDAVLKNEGGKIIPYGSNGGNEGFGFIPFERMNPEYVSFRAQVKVFGALHVTINSDKTVDIYTMGEDPAMSKLPAPYNTYDFLYRPYNKAKEWYEKGYVEKDVMNQKDANGYFKVGKFASLIADTAQYQAVEGETENNVAGAKVEFEVIDPAIRAKQPGSIRTDFKAWNFSCIPVNSKNIERTMLFFDWLFANEDNHSLFELGIQGQHWVAEGTEKYKIPEGVTADSNYNFPGYVLTWNPNYIRYPSEWSEELVDYGKFTADPNAYTKEALSGFSFNNEPVKSEVVKVDPIISLYMNAAANGMIEDPKVHFEEMLEKIKALGLDKIKAEYKKQIEAFLVTQ